MKLQKENIPFTMVANKVLCENTLSWKAKGLYAYLFSKPDGWNFSGDRVVKEGADKRYSVFSGLKELEQKGFLKRKRHPTGKIEYHLLYSLNPLDDNQQMASPDPFDDNCKVQLLQSAIISNVSNKDREKEGNTNNKDYVWLDYLNQMFNDKREAIQIIAFYFQEKKISFDTKDQAQAAIKRHLRAANEVAKFPENKVRQAMKVAVDQYKDIFTIETILKILTR